MRLLSKKTLFLSIVVFIVVPTIALCLWMASEIIWGKEYLPSNELPRCVAPDGERTLILGFPNRRSYVVRPVGFYVAATYPNVPNNYFDSGVPSSCEWLDKPKRIVINGSNLSANSSLEPYEIYDGEWYPIVLHEMKR
jgi:hypothetical protein